MERTTHVFRADATAELEAYAEAHSTDGENWEGNNPIFVTHQTYGSLDSFVHAAVTFTGSRFIEEEDAALLTSRGEGFSGMSQEGFENWYYGMSDAFLLMVSNPIAWIQGNFFIFLLVVMGVIVFAPLVLYAYYITAITESGKGG